MECKIYQFQEVIRDLELEKSKILWSSGVSEEWKALDKKVDVLYRWLWQLHIANKKVKEESKNEDLVILSICLGWVKI